MTTMTNSPAAAGSPDTSPEALRAAMVDGFVADRRLIPGLPDPDERVLAVMRTVPRHQFVPDVSLDQAYAEEAVITKTAPDGASLSCASMPGVVALMLHQLQVRAGDRVLEIGAGTGYNAALLAELTGPTGQVTTVDIDPDVTSRARHALDATGYQRVQVITGDGQLGDAGRAPYDRIIVTVGPWDIPPAWRAQLVDGGRMVAPLRWRGQARSVAFIQRGDVLMSDGSELCGFVPMLGDGQEGERTTYLDPGKSVKITWDIDQDLDPQALTGVLDRPRQDVWSGQWVGSGEPFDGVWLRLTATEPGTCRIAADPAAVHAGLCDPAIPVRSPALADTADTSSVAYLTLRRADDGARRWELGATGHGPHGADLAERLCAQIRAWSPHRTAQPTITAYPAGTPTTRLRSGMIIDKPHTRFVIAY